MRPGSAGQRGHRESATNHDRDRQGGRAGPGPRGGSGDRHCAPVPAHAGLSGRRPTPSIRAGPRGRCSGLTAEGTGKLNVSRGDASGPRGTGRPRPSGTSRCASQKPRKASPPGSSGARALVRQPPGLRSERTHRPGGGLRRLQPCTPPLPSSASKCACHFLTSRPRPCPSRSPPRGLGHRHVESGDCGPERGGPKPRPGAWGRALASRCLWTTGSDPTRPHVVTGQCRRVSPAPRDSGPHEASRDAAWRLRPSPDEERRPARLLCL